MSGPSFSATATRRLVVASVASLLVCGLLVAFGPEIFDVVSAGGDGFSRSAIGHHAALRVLREAGYPVVLSRHATAARIGESIVVLAEPDLDEGGPRAATIDDILERAPSVLVVLPKRAGLPAPERPGWLASTRPRPMADAQRVLDTVARDGRVVRPAASAAWRGPLPAPTIDDVQLFTAPGFEPLVATDAGMLAGERRDQGSHLIVLADPDVLATHGLGRGDNAVLLVRLLERLGGSGRTLLVDETLHGHELLPSIPRELLRFPLVLATFQAALVAALLAWAAWVRFGRPRRSAVPPGSGKLLLLESAAGLLAHGGHVAPAIAAYWRAAQETVAHALRPPGQRTERPEQWLRGLAAARGHGETLERLERRVSDLRDRDRAEHEALRLAVDIHRWREEMIDASGSHP